MAEITAPRNADQRHPGVKRSKKLSTRVDLTPMVDLGFLLITFFVFTTTMSAPTALHFNIPADGDSTMTAEAKTLNLVLSGNNQVHYYVGNDVGKQSCTDFSPEGVRRVVRNMQSLVRGKFGADEQVVVLIRPTEAASYMNLVDILDEMLILGVKKYALMDMASNQITDANNLRKPC